MKTGDKAILRKGWGYWDTTAYPIGGCFRRATQDLYLVITETPSKPGGYYRARFDRPTMQGGTVAVSLDAIRKP